MFTALLFTTAWTVSQPPQATLESLKAEAPRRWEEYDAFLEQAEIREVSTYRKYDKTNAARDAGVLKHEAHLVVKGPRAKIVETKHLSSNASRAAEAGTHSVKVLCANDNYAFALDGGNSLPPVYKLVEYEGSAPESMRKKVKDRASTAAYGWRPNGVRINEWWTKSNWSVSNFKPSTDPPGIEITATHSIPVKDKTYRIEHSAVVNPAARWRVESYRIRTPDVRDVSMRMSYPEADDGPVPYPTRVEFIEIMLTSGERLEATIEFPVFRVSDAEESEFTLSAFGLPDPIGRSVAKPTPVYVWALVAAGGATALTLLFLFLRRRSQRSVLTPGQIGGS